MRYLALIALLAPASYGVGVVVTSPDGQRAAEVTTTTPAANAPGLVARILGTINVAGAADVVSTGAPTTFGANTVCTGQLLLAGTQGAGFQLNAGTLAATFQPQYSLEASGANWTPTQFIDQNGAKTPSLVTTNPNALFQQGIVLVTGARRVQVCTTSYTSGSATGFADAAYVQGGAAAGGSSGLTDTQLRASPVQVSSSTLPLPTGAATESTLALIKADADRIPTSPATDRALANAPFSVRSSDGANFYDSRLIRLLTGADAVSISGSVAVTGIFWQVTQPVSIAAALDVLDRTSRLLGHVTVDNASLAATQSGAWSMGRTWSLLNTTDSVNAVQSGAWAAGRTWSLLNSTDSVNVGNFPATQTVGGSVSVSNFPTAGALDTSVTETHGIEGFIAPAKAEMVAGIDPQGNLQALATTRAGAVVVIQSNGLNVLLPRCNAVRRSNCNP